ncbi:hypothetical protein [Bacteroides sp. 224]|uniref:hypothetical protein n=1 Tax=Bacteroides sp. 224 TaxID=2302936 RepID=UPI0013D41952|nr:hypothetical protein [Bacteroides sp. 224]NDV63977.1 hypothetical protein [Bacteroides sp. 224]
MKKLEDIRGQLKPVMTNDELAVLYAQISYFKPNKNRVGRWAKTLGYRLTKQMIDRKVLWFYINEQIED